MTMLKKNISFFNRQIDQIREGGIHVLHRKIKKMFRLLFMNICAPLVVQFKIDWAKAYDFAGRKNLRKLKKLRKQPNPSESAIKKIEEQAIKHFKTIVDRGPASVNEQDWIDASRTLGGLYFHPVTIEQMNDVFQKEAEVQRNIAKAHQFEDLEIEFLPRYLPIGSIGNYEHLDVYVKAGMLGFRPSKKLILLIDPKAPVNNPCYLNYWKRYITVISDPLLVEMLTPLEKRLTIPLNLYMLLREKIYKSFLALGIVREQWIKEERLPVLTLSDEDYERGWQCLKSFGMRQGDWFVCLHVRESGWKDNNSPSEDFRNADISTYQLAIKAVVDAGGWVVRMGDSTMKQLPKMPQVIDYAHSGAKSDWMDVFLCAQCRFFISTSSGLYTIALAFGVPVVMTNQLPVVAMYMLSSRDIFIPRICRSKAENRTLTFSESISLSLGLVFSQHQYDGLGVDVVENTAEEIKDIVMEMLERFNGNLVYSEENEYFQGKFKSLADRYGKLYGDEDIRLNARIGRNFLRKYTALLFHETKFTQRIEIT